MCICVTKLYEENMNIYGETETMDTVYERVASLLNWTHFSSIVLLN